MISDIFTMAGWHIEEALKQITTKKWLLLILAKNLCFGIIHIPTSFQNIQVEYIRAMDMVVHSLRATRLIEIMLFGIRLRVRTFLFIQSMLKSIHLVHGIVAQ